MSGVRDPDIIRQEIAETRQQLGGAVEELAAKTNVKARAWEKLTALQQTVGTLPQRAREHRAATAALTAGLLAVAAIVRR